MTYNFGKKLTFCSLQKGPQIFQKMGVYLGYKTGMSCWYLVNGLYYNPHIIYSK